VGSLDSRDNKVRKVSRDRKGYQAKKGTRVIPELPAHRDLLVPRVRKVLKVYRATPELPALKARKDSRVIKAIPARLGHRARRV